MSRIVRFFLILLAAPALAQDPSGPTILEYVKNHSSVVSGVAVANGETVEYVSVALDAGFEVRPKLHAFGSLSLFGRQRVEGGTVESPSVPLELADLALYSAGEIQGGLFFQAWPKMAFECRAGSIFSMRAITGTKGEPTDPSKFLFGCGPRVSGATGRLSMILGHYGNVDEGAKFYGFIPSTYFDGEFNLTKGVSLIVRIAAGRDVGTQKAVTSSWFAARKRF